MTIFKNRPLCVYAFVFLLTMVIAVSLHPHILFLFGGFAFLLGLVLLIPTYKYKAKAVPFGIAALVVCFSILVFTFGIYLPHERVKEYAAFDEVLVECQIMDITQETEQYRDFRVKVTDINGFSCNLSLAMTDYSDAQLEIGDRLEGFASIGYGEQYVVSEGTFGTLEFLDWFEVTEHENNLFYYADSIQNSISDYFSTLFSPDVAHVMSAMLIGDTAKLSPFMKLQFKRLSISHVLSISGMHFSVLVFAVSKVLSFFKIPKNKTRVILLLFIPLYALVAGLSAAILRSGCMTLIMLLAGFSKREQDPITSLLFAASLIVTVSPTTVVDIGFWMSVIATFGLLILEELPKRIPWLEKHPRLYAAVIEPVSLTAIATTLTLPITWYYFGTFSLLFLVANLLFSFLFTWFMYVGVIVAIVPPLAYIGNLYCEFVLKILKLGSRMDNIYLYIREGIYQVLILALVGCTLALLVIKVKRAVKPLLLCIASLSLIFFLTIGIYTAIGYKNGAIEVSPTAPNADHVFSHYENKTVIVESPGSLAASIKSISANLSQYGELDIDGWVFTDYDSRIEKILYKVAGIAKIHAIYLPTPHSPYETELYNSVRAVCESYEIPLYTIDAFVPTVIANTTVMFYDRNPKYSEDEPAISAYYLSVNKTTCVRLSNGYAISQFASDLGDKAPDILIYGGTNRQDILPEIYPYQDASEWIYISPKLLDDIAPLPEESQKFWDYKSHTYPLKQN